MEVGDNVTVKGMQASSARLFVIADPLLILDPPLLTAIHTLIVPHYTVTVKRECGLSSIGVDPRQTLNVDQQ